MCGDIWLEGFKYRGFIVIRKNYCIFHNNIHFLFLDHARGHKNHKIRIDKTKFHLWSEF